MKGKKICNVLREVRQRIADANGISYHPHDCHYEGDCLGTCPACEQEKSYLETSLKELKRQGFAIKVAGIAAGLIASASTIKAQAIQKTETVLPPSEVEPRETLETIDLSNGAEDAITINGKIVDDNNSPEDGVNIIVSGITTHKAVSNSNGEFSIKVSPNANLKFRSIRCKSKVVAVKSLLVDTSNVIQLKRRKVRVPGISMGFIEPRYGTIITNCENPVDTVKTQSDEKLVSSSQNKPKHGFVDYSEEIKKSSGTLQTFDLSNGAKDPILVKGKVVDKDGPLIGASIRVIGSNSGLSTNCDGEFSLLVSKKAVLFITYIGMVTKKIAARKVRAEKPIVLKAEKKSLTGEVEIINTYSDGVYGRSKSNKAK